MERYFLIGIGGTGMRCLESFVHLCAMGMFDDCEINILALDTDRDNGNFRRLKTLVNAYLDTKGVEKGAPKALSNTFFSAKINYFEFSPNYSKPSTGKFSRLTKYGDLRDRNPKAADLADLLLTENTREFDLKHGYRAQTHLGSYLMYHSILQEYKENHKGKLAEFIDSIILASQDDTTKVFVMGSVFGGTGASSIPIIPKVFNKAAEIKGGYSLDHVFFGSTLLNTYFTFKAPGKDYEAKQKVVAIAEKFAMNSQAAMMFYNDDKTVKHTYQKFYMLGTPKIQYATETVENETVTGGARQENNSHYIELFAAFAAYDFFNSQDNELSEIKNDSDGVRYFFRTIDDDGNMDFGDFLPQAEEKQFAKRFGLLTAMSFVTNLDKYDFYASAQNGVLGKNDNIEDYEDIDPREVKAIKKYFDLYHFKIDNDKILNGWLRQLHNSAGGEDKFLFHHDMFGLTTRREFEKFKFNEKIFLENENYKKHHYDVGFFGNAFHEFKKAFKEKAEDAAISNRCEKLIKRMYDTLCTLYKF